MDGEGSYDSNKSRDEYSKQTPDFAAQIGRVYPHGVGETRDSLIRENYARKGFTDSRKHPYFNGRSYSFN